ncbi:multiple inositol polyphosphate phosphatase 1 isoform X2 [Ceratina calcarata]|nr:multiple inositol polyphosphate phosphatase 1 isoform X2 [Ceratina calcarata]XP_026670580.1 multiple inositol polyphosphate phosphatase 1 isoform X2 [Ceratina calcarata]
MNVTTKMPGILNVYIFLIINAIIVLPTFAHNCLLYNNDYKCRLATKTPYRLVMNNDDSPLDYPGCEPKKIWLILRHGARYPGKKHISNLIKRLPQIQKLILKNYASNKTKLSKEIIDSFIQWEITFTEDDVMKLVEEGENEMIDISERYQSRFPSLMPEIYDNQTYRFKYTATQRTEKSAKSFAIGLFGKYNSERIQYPKPEHADPVLRFYKRCQRWQLEVKHNATAQIEKRRFLESEFYKKMVANISKLIGHKIDYESIHLMYLICGFETAWYKNSESPWCKLFSLHDLKVLEFAEDLGYYWVDGYGYELTYEQACPAMRDVFNFLLSADGPSVSAYFTHSGTILKLLALLRVYKDDQHLTHNLFSLYANDRAWRTGVIDTFGANIAFVLYDCSGFPYVLFMHQERQVPLPGCPVYEPCPLSTMKALYPTRDEECPFELMCTL